MKRFVSIMVICGLIAAIFLPAAAAAGGGAFFYIEALGTVTPELPDQTAEEHYSAGVEWGIIYESGAYRLYGISDYAVLDDDHAYVRYLDAWYSVDKAGLSALAVIPDAGSSEDEKPYTGYLLMPDVISAEDYEAGNAPVFRSIYQRGMISAIIFTDSLEGMADAESSWDVSYELDGSIMAWVVPDGDMYALYIGCDGGYIKANANCQTLFAYYSGLRSIEFNGVFDTSEVRNMESMFLYCSSLSSLDLSSFDTGSVTNMKAMFGGCSALVSLDISGFDTGSVDSMHSMFTMCSSLVSLDLSGLDTSAVTSMRYMFYGCTSLVSVDFTGFDTRNVISMSDMFTGCSSMVAADISSFDTRRVVYFQNMFANCESLQEIYISNSFVFGENADSNSVSQLCQGCPDGVRVINVDAPEESVTKEAAVRSGNVLMADTDFSDAEGMDGYVLGSDIRRSEITTISFVDTAKTTPGSGAWDVSADGNGSVFAWIVEDDAGKKLFIGGDGGVDANPDCTKLFAGYVNVQAFNFDNEFFTGDARIVDCMFMHCYAVESLDLSSFDTSAVISMNGMFFGCTNLKSLDVSGFDTRNTTNMGSMFEGCKAMTALDITSFDTANVLDMNSMFGDCQLLTELAVSETFVINEYCFTDSIDYDAGISVAEVTGFTGYTDPVPAESGNVLMSDGMTQEQYSSLTGYVLGSDISRSTIKYVAFVDTGKTAPGEGAWDVSAAGDGSVLAWTVDIGAYSYLFIGGDGGVDANKDCRFLFALYEVVNGFDFNGMFYTGNTESMNSMFGMCTSIRQLDLTSFDTSNVERFNCTFAMCVSLQTLNLETWDTSSAEDMSGMFMCAKGLVEIDISSFDTSNVTDMTSMFYGCENLKDVYVSDSFVIRPDCEVADFDKDAGFSVDIDAYKQNGTEPTAEPDDSLIYEFDETAAPFDGRWTDIADGGLSLYIPAEAKEVHAEGFDHGYEYDGGILCAVVYEPGMYGEASIIKYMEGSYSSGYESVSRNGYKMFVGRNADRDICEMFALCDGGEVCRIMFSPLSSSVFCEKSLHVFASLRVNSSDTGLLFDFNEADAPYEGMWVELNGEKASIYVPANAKEDSNLDDNYIYIGRFGDDGVAGVLYYEAGSRTEDGVVRYMNDEYGGIYEKEDYGTYIVYAASNDEGGMLEYYYVLDNGDIYRLAAGPVDNEQARAISLHIVNSLQIND